MLEKIDSGGDNFLKKIVYEGGRIRTFDPRLKRPLLCQLSYAPGIYSFSVSGSIFQWDPAALIWVFHLKALSKDLSADF